MKIHNILIRENVKMVMMTDGSTEVLVPIFKYSKCPKISQLGINEKHLYVINIKNTNNYGFLGSHNPMKIKGR